MPQNVLAKNVCDTAWSHFTIYLITASYKLAARKTSVGSDGSSSDPWLVRRDGCSPGSATGGNTSDMIESLRLTEKNRIPPAVMVTHIGGLDSAAEATLKLPELPGGKKLIYTGIDMELTALDDFAAKGEKNPHFARLAEICQKHKGLWNAEAEKYLLEHWQ